MPPERREKVDERLQITRACDRIFNMRRDLGVDVLGGIQQAICLVYGAEDLGVIFVKVVADNRVFKNGVLPRPGIASSDKTVVVIARYMNQKSLHGRKLEHESIESKCVIWI